MQFSFWEIQNLDHINYHELMKLKMCNRQNYYFCEEKALGRRRLINQSIFRDPTAPLCSLLILIWWIYSYRAFDKLEGVEVVWSQSRINDSVMVCSQKMDQLNMEIQLLKTFRHKNIVKMFASWIDEDKGIVNIITEYFTSGSLRQYAPFLSFILLWMLTQTCCIYLFKNDSALLSLKQIHRPLCDYFTCGYMLLFQLTTWCFCWTNQCCLSYVKICWKSR